MKNPTSKAKCARYIVHSAGALYPSICMWCHIGKTFWIHTTMNGYPHRSELSNITGWLRVDKPEILNS